MTEEWRPVVGYPKYEVSNLGRVRSLDHMKWSGPAGHTKVKGRILVLSLGGQGYPLVSLGYGNKHAVHILVSAAFIGPRPDGMLCLHDDDNKQNPVLSNLKYGTRSENNEDTYKNGIRKREDNSRRAKKAVITRTIKKVGICRFKNWHDL